MAELSIDERRLGVDLHVSTDPDDDILQTPTGDLPQDVGRANLHEALRRRVVTQPGALLFRPDYGAGVPGYVEGAGNPTTRSQMANAIKRNMLRDPRLSDATVTATAGTESDPRASAVTIALAITVRKDDTADSLTLVVE